MKEYFNSIEEVFREYKTNINGLDQMEADSRLQQNGKNKLTDGKSESILHRFIMQLAEPMTIILIVAAIISAITSIYSNEFPSDVIIILLVVIINAVLGVYQESKADKAIDALQKITAATSKVIRGGKQESIPSENIIVGDIVVLEAGDSIPADCRIIETASLKIEESALTGESVPVNKQTAKIEPIDSEDVPLGDRKNMCYMGSNAVYGRGKAVVVKTGMDTEMGQIADALTKAKDNDTPLQIKLNQLSKILSVIVIVICAFIFALDIIRGLISGGPSAITFDSILNTFMIAVSLAVAAIPEGIAAVVTIALSIGVTKMSKRNAVIRKLTAVETLGCTQVICSDKTGTLTQNKMTVVEYKGESEKKLAQGMALCSDAIIEDGVTKGEPTEAALVEWAYKLGISKNNVEESYKRVGEAPFDSNRKMMSTVHTYGDKYIQYTKGAPDVVLSHCSCAMINGNESKMDENVYQQIMNENKEMADKALRVLACSIKFYNEIPNTSDVDSLEENLCYIGLVGMIDPVREEVVDAVAECRQAGIRPIMITGDHKDTAVAIAKQLGILTNEDEAITGSELDKLTDEDLSDQIEKYSVYARVQPEHKVRIVKAWQSHGMITAMTGDGVNDAPSIKNADIGIGMGITGTDVTKNVADMVLADDNFATIVAAVEEGRRIYDNIRKTIQFLLSSNLSEVFTILVATLAGFTILEPVHLLWINLITDCLPSIALGMEKGEGNIMNRKPRKKTDGIFANGLGIDVLWQGIMVTVLTLCAYVIGAFILADEGSTETMLHQNGMTMAFLTLSMAEVFHSFNMRSRRQSIFKMGSHNFYLYLAMIMSLLLSTAVIYIPPLATAFDFAEISLLEYITALVLSILVIPIVEIVKVFQRIYWKRKYKKELKLEK